MYLVNKQNMFNYKNLKNGKNVHPLCANVSPPCANVSPPCANVSPPYANVTLNIKIINLKY